MSARKTKGEHVLSSRAFPSPCFGEPAAVGRGGTGCRSSDGPAASGDGVQSSPSSPPAAMAMKQSCLHARGLWAPPRTAVPITCQWPQVATLPGYAKTWEESTVESRAAAVLPRWREKKKAPNNILFMLCSFFTFLLFLVRLCHTQFSCSLLTGVREPAQSSPLTRGEKPKPEHH